MQDESRFQIDPTYGYTSLEIPGIYDGIFILRSPHEGYPAMHSPMFQLKLLQRTPPTHIAETRGRRFNLASGHKLGHPTLCKPCITKAVTIQTCGSIYTQLSFLPIKY